MRNVFAAYHPAVGFSYLCAAIALCMAAFHPAYVVLSLAGAVACGLVVQGLRPTAKALAMALPLVACIALANLALSSAGFTEVARIGHRAFYLEAAAFGATMGGLFAAMMLWFANYAAIMDSEATASLMGSALPTVSLMLTQVVGLVPQFLRRGHAIAAVQSATTASAMPGEAGALASAMPGEANTPDASMLEAGVPETNTSASRPRTRRARKGVAAQGLRALSVLMSWGMEDGIVRADCMRARGFGCGRPRTRYRRQRFVWRDGLMLGVVAVLAAANAVLAAQACSAFEFYPVAGPLTPWWGYAVYAAMMALPLVLAAREQLLWR